MAYTQEQVDRLRAVFDLVKNSENWKQPIDAEIFSWLATEDEIREAVVFYAGCVPTIKKCTVSGRHKDGLVVLDFPGLRVRAEGYYAAVGA